MGDNAPPWSLADMKSLKSESPSPMKLLEPLARWSAVLAGLLITGITLMTCVSLIGRGTIGKTLAGDFELSGVAAGAAIGLGYALGQVSIAGFSLGVGAVLLRPDRYVAGVAKDAAALEHLTASLPWLKPPPSSSP